MAPGAQGPSERPVRFAVPPLGLLGCGCLEGGVGNTHRDHAIALRGVILGNPVTQVRSPNAFARSAATSLKALVQSATVRCGLDGGFCRRESKMLACGPQLHGATTAKSDRDESTRYGPDESTVRVTSVSQRGINGAVAMCVGICLARSPVG
jgi:hypothetical protein